MTRVRSRSSISTIVLFVLAPFLAPLFGSGIAAAQPILVLPQASPKATVTQMVGLTEMSVEYSRPAVAKRAVWGALVPWNEVWRAGANDNTKVSFSTPVTIDGHKLPAGTYGLHVLPAQKSWTIIFSTMAAAWGSYTYDQKEDALRVVVTPQSAEHTERLTISFDDPGETSTTLALRWEKLRVALKVEVDTKAVTVASLRNQLRNTAGFTARGWSEAAAWCLQNDTNLDEASAWIERSIKMAPNFDNQMVKAALLEKRHGDAKEIAALRAKALAGATEVDINRYAYTLLFQGKLDEALGFFERNAKAHPESWNAWDSLGEGQDKKGDKRAAIESYTKAEALAADPMQKQRIGQVLTRLKAK